MLGLAAVPVMAQEQGSLAVATLDQEALFLNSAFGRRVTRELERDRDALTAENREIEADLIAEERALIDRRAELPPAEFAPLAEAFDTKVERIRTEQDRKGRALQVQFEEARQRFLSEIGPVLTDLLRERGAQVLLDRGAVLISVEGVDITAAAIAAIDARLGDGTSGGAGLPDRAPAPDGGTAPGTDPDGQSAPQRP
ncbi:OmpH family outer membrane protein [Meridianimarinicoccus sp. RP-17]|uniref:OmpH family outer membrane protein n=1 Tax=Meridianimarinicoccus zhengii TaxID=2056810 RepID=UPI0013A6DE78|nr:OmpH family outer membrane protein [Phycocomes zhengii]